jgi:hypothetical protein
MLRAIWLDRNDAAFNATQRSLGGIVNRFLDALNKTHHALHLRARRRKKEAAHALLWATNDVFAQLRADGRIRIPAPDEIRAIVNNA